MIHFQIQLGTAAGETASVGVDNEMVLGVARASFLIGAGHQLGKKSRSEVEVTKK